MVDASLNDKFDIDEFDSSLENNSEFDNFLNKLVSREYAFIFIEDMFVYREIIKHLEFVIPEKNYVFVGKNGINEYFCCKGLEEAA